MCPLAPLHQPNNLAPIRSHPRAHRRTCRRSPASIRRSIAATARSPIITRFPSSFYAEGVRRYGFHGLSYEYIAGRLPEVAPEIAAGRVIVAHLGSGASMCALAGGRSVESTMGFTALDGLPMGTRPGQIDPGVVLYLIRQKGMTAAEVQDLLYRECGLKGLSGISNDVRELEASADPSAQFALDYFVYRVGLHAGMLAAALGGVDAFVFTAGIGENSPALRARIAENAGLARRRARSGRQRRRRSSGSPRRQPGRAPRRPDRRGTDDRAPYRGAAVGDAARRNYCTKEVERSNGRCIEDGIEKSVVIVRMCVERRGVFSRK